MVHLIIFLIILIVLYCSVTWYVAYLFLFTRITFKCKCKHGINHNIHLFNLPAVIFVFLNFSLVPLILSWYIRRKYKLETRIGNIHFFSLHNVDIVKNGFSIVGYGTIIFDIVLVRSYKDY